MSIGGLVLYVYRKRAQIAVRDEPCYRRRPGVLVKANGS
jgi:hypothetical protein